MAQALRVVTSAEVSAAMHEAPPLSVLDTSMVETVMSYVESNNLDGAHTYAAAMSSEGLGRALRNLTSAASVFAVALVKKKLMRE